MITIRMIFSNFYEWVKDNEYTEDAKIPPVSEEEAKVLAEKALSILEISDEDIERFTIERYWKWESDVEAVVVCRGEEYPEKEKLLKLGTVWKDFSDNILSTSMMPENKMMNMLELIDIWLN